MSKRKYKNPTQLNSSKRWLLSWNMIDCNQLGASTSYSAIPTTLYSTETTVDPSISLSPSIVHGNVKSVEGGTTGSAAEQTGCKLKVQALPHHITSEYYKILWKWSNYSITIHEQHPQDKIIGQLSLITLVLRPHQLAEMPSSEPPTGKNDRERCNQFMPNTLPRGRCSLFVSPTKPYHLVFDYALDNAENARNGVPSNVYLCLEAELVNEPAEVYLDSLEHVCHHHKSKLKLIRQGYSPKTGQLSLSVCLLQPALCIPRFASEPVRTLVHAHHMQSLMHWLHGFPPPAPREIPTSKRHDFNQLFNAVRCLHSQNGDHSITLAVQLQHPCLVPTLREYQRQAVSWMLWKERFGERVEVEQQVKEDGRLHCMWSKLKLTDQTLYYNYQSGQFTRHRLTQLPSFPGGILADEMGLGKTVEVLACILAHPRYPSSPTSTKTDEASMDTKGCASLPEEITDAIGDTNSGVKSSSSRRWEHQSESSDIVLVESDATAESQEGSSRATEEEANETPVDAKRLESVSEPMDQSPASSSEEVKSSIVESSCHESSEDGNTVLDDISKTASQPKILGQNSDSSDLGLIPASSEGDSEKAIPVTSVMKNIEAKPEFREQTSEVSAKLVSTNCLHLLPAASVDPALPISNDLRTPELDSQATDTDVKLPSGSQEKIHGEATFLLENPCKTGAQISVDKNRVKPKCENETPAPCSYVVDEAGQSLSTLSVLEGTVSKGSTSIDVESVTSSELQQIISSLTVKEPQTAHEQPAEDSVIIQKPKRKLTPKGPIPNPYARLKTKVPPKFRFECICGVHEEELDVDLSMQCQRCRGWQHCNCVNYSKQSLEDDGYLCPMCCVEQPAVPSRATLIVSPTSICHQWVDEINRHIHNQTLNMLVYQGVKMHGFLQPKTLANHDIVITTYDTLRTELNYVDLPHTNSDNGRRLRHAKRYMAVPSPLPAVEWWRVCLDEAQMVECPTAKVAEMALRLTAVNRWCVTGTPIQRDLDNLYGLFLFLGVEPYWVKSWWDNMLYKPYLHGNQEPMEKALAEVLWRSAKKDVIHQINIPAQTEQTHWLQFSPIEMHFYKRKQEHCSKDLLHVAGRLKMDVKTRLRSLARDTVNRLMNPLLRLRQACCHPQAVRGEFVSMQRTTLTMTELLQSLTLKAKVESEEAHRQLVCSLNGLAAVCIIKGETLDAIQRYRDVLQSVEEHKDRLKTDSLQRLHTMHNVHQLLKLKPDGVVPTLRDGGLEKQVQEIRDAYLAKAEAALQSSLNNLLPLQEKITELQAQLSPRTPWWLDGLQWLRYIGSEEEFLGRITDMLTSTTHVDNMSIANHFSTLQGLQLVLVTKTEELENAYKRLQAGMDELNVEVTQELVADATDCHLRPFGGKPKNRCPFCRVHTLFTEFETCLFSIKQRDILAETDSDEDTGAAGPRLQGSWGASEMERVLRSLLAYLRQHDGDEELLEEGGVYLEMMDTQKKEFKSMRVSWTMLCERVAAWDELKMATMRLRLREAHEPEEITSQANVIEPGELDQQRFKLLNDRVLAQSELKKKLGQLVYLRSLANAHSDLPDGNNPEPCPICVRVLGKQWTVLPCGHSFCANCMDMMRAHRGKQHKTVSCAICRSVALIQEVSYVSTELTNQQEDSTIPVKGGFSTKVETVVRTLLQLREQDPNVKAIVFSTWVDVLTVIAKALRDNGIEFRSIGPPGDRHFKVNLMDFKQEDGVTVLLLPVHSGSKGLNIIEATHVLLVEPILNPASELQAVGRVHRIGQTRQTVVHRFLVRDTIEERLHAFLQANHTSDSLNNLEGETGALTLGNLKQLFTDESLAPDHTAADSCQLSDDEY